MSVDLPSSTLPQVINFNKPFPFLSILEIPLSLSAFHAANCFIIDDAARPFRRYGAQRFIDDGIQRIGIGFDAPCQRIAAQGPEAYLLVHDFFSRLEAHAVVVDMMMLPSR